MAMRYSSPFNLANLRQSLFRKQKNISAEMIEVIKKGAEQIMEDSKANAPVDTHNLEEAHHIKTRETRADNIGIDIEVSGIGGGSDPRDVGEYAMEMHEGHYNLGPASQAKQAANPKAKVGRKYLENAVDENKAKILAAMKAAVKRNL